MAGVILFILGTLGLALIARGVVGRRVGDRPYCRGCRYDLSGILSTAESCPECGSSLSPKNAVVRGIRKRRLASLVLGLILVLAASGTIGTSAWAKANNFDFNTIKPTWILLGEMERGDEWQDTGATYEVAQRLMAGSLSDTSIDRYAQAVLDKASPSTMPYDLAVQSAWWGHHVEVLLVDPSTPDDVRTRLASFALDQLGHVTDGTTALEPSHGTHLFLAPMDHLLAIGQLTDEQARSFLKLRVVPKVSLMNESGPGARPVWAQVVAQWPSTRAFLEIFGNRTAFPRTLGWSTVVYQEPVVLLECLVIDDEAPAENAVSQSWYVSAAGPISSPDSAGQTRSKRFPPRPDLSSPPVLEIAQFVASQAPTAPGQYTITFDIRITLLNSDPANPDSYLEPDDNSISVVRRVELPLIVEPTRTPPGRDGNP
jgi:hypothetical protein